MLECWSILAGLATCVPRVRLGSLVSNNAFRHPAVLANVAASVDHLSGGRVVLGLGAGWQPNEHEAYGIELQPPPERLARLNEACVVIRQLLENDRTIFKGKYYELRDAPMEPKPLQRKLPLLIGGAGGVTLGIAALWADEWNMWGSPDSVAARSSVLDRRCESMDRDPAEVSRSAQAIVDLQGTWPSRSDFPVIRGDVHEVQEALQAYARAGVSEFILPDWCLGEARGRHDALDHFLAEVAAPFR